MLRLAALSAVLSLIPQALAHGGVLSYSIGGQWYPGWQPYNSPSGQTSIQRPWDTFDPILDASDPTLSCNNNGQSGPLQLTATVAAGSAVTAYWNDWPHPYGPMLTYLARCPGSTCTGVNSNTLQWFKIDESGLISGTIGNGYWGSGKMIDDNNTWTTTIPSSVPSGHYLIRFETIALHSLPAQFYPECAQLEITGGGSRAPTAAELVTFPGGYSNSDPGLSVVLYSGEAQTSTNYIIPGPPLYGGGNTGPGPSQPPTPSTSSSSSSTAPSSTSSSAPTSTPPSTGTVTQWGQCGGTGWTGGTVCIAPYTCHVINPYYHQCY
ncbi:hypothetical protein ONZ45_g9305 [Pleurotus djamor]|nr:hypothetical protein ONZ45_g9305 [Pleurotus djamor]